MRLVLVLALLITFSATAKIVHLKVTTIQKSKTQESKTITTIHARLGKMWELPLEAKNSLKLKMNIDEHYSNPEDKGNPLMMELMMKAQLIETINGQEKLIASPEIITVLGKDASITTEDLKSGESLEIKIVATKIIEDI